MSERDLLTIQKEIERGREVIGLELSSTRIKAVLVGSDNVCIGIGEHEWENTLLDGVWTYPLEEVWSGILACVALPVSVVVRSPESEF